MRAADGAYFMAEGRKNQRVSRSSSSGRENETMSMLMATGGRRWRRRREQHARCDGSSSEFNGQEQQSATAAACIVDRKKELVGSLNAASSLIFAGGLWSGQTMPCKAFLSWWPFFSLGWLPLGGWGLVGVQVEVVFGACKASSLVAAQVCWRWRMADAGWVCAGWRGSR